MWFFLCHQSVCNVTLSHICLFSGAVAVHQSQIQGQEKELQELRDCHSEPVQGDCQVKSGQAKLFWPDFKNTANS